jgi:hypothetical protein
LFGARIAARIMPVWRVELLLLKQRLHMGRWLGMLPILNQSSGIKTYNEFDEPAGWYLQATAMHSSASQIHETGQITRCLLGDLTAPLRDLEMLELYMSALGMVEAS